MRSGTLHPICIALALLGCSSSHATNHPDDAGALLDASLDGGNARSCSQPSDCMVVSAGCCPVCGRPTLDDVTALRRDALPARAESCRHMLCPACAETANPSLIATCDQGRCEVVDLEQSNAVSACENDSNCRVRVTSCCECGGDTNPYALVAIAVDGEHALTDLVCNHDPVLPCQECAPLYPSNVTASCSPTSGHCAVNVQ